MKKLLFIILIFSISSCENSDNHTTVESNNTKNIEIKGNTIHITNNFYKHYIISDNEVNKDVILNIIQKESIQKGTKTSISHLNIQPYQQNNAWTISAKAHEIEVRDNTITTIFKAQDEVEDTYGYYNLETGVHLFDCTYDVLKVKIPNTNFKRYIGYTSRSNANELLINEDKDVVGIISYASESKLLKQFLIKTKEDVGLSTPDMELVSFSENAKLFEGNQVLFFWDLNENYKATDIDFAFGYSYFIGEDSDETAILFEVIDDELLLSNTKYDNKVFEIIEK